LNPVGSAPEAEVALATAEEADALTLEIALATLLGPREAAEEEADSTALEAPEVMELTTEETELAIDWETEADDAADEADEACDEADSEATELMELATESRTMLVMISDIN
jgi:hypothetical protein